MEMQDAIKLWKELKISSAEFSFSCGNDSMDDTEFTFSDKVGNEVISEELSNYFDDAIYDNVNFYIHSTYEYGTVSIELNDDGDGFSYVKYAMYEEYELENSVERFELTTEQAQFLKEYVRDMSSSGVINYKKDFVLTEELNEMIIKLQHEFMEFAENWSYKYDAIDESVEYDMNTITEEDGKFYAELNVGCTFSIYYDSV